MTIAQLKKKYGKKELSEPIGDRELRYEAFAPLFENLYENKLVYFEYGRTQLVRVEKLQITPDQFWGIAVPHLLIDDDKHRHLQLFDAMPEWAFRSRWENLRLEQNCLAGYYTCWRIWTDPELVQQVEQLTLNKEFKKALALTTHSVKNIDRIDGRVEEIPIEEFENF